MQWISREPPIYVWEGDTWRNEKEDKIYVANLDTRSWISGIDTIEFPKKTVLMDESRSRTNSTSPVTRATISDESYRRTKPLCSCP